jgi:hypothetical protein
MHDPLEAVVLEQCVDACRAIGSNAVTVALSDSARKITEIIPLYMFGDFRYSVCCLFIPRRLCPFPHQTEGKYKITYAPSFIPS